MGWRPQVTIRSSFNPMGSMAQRKRRKPDEKARKEEVVLLKDLAPRKDVKGGAKLRFGEAPSAGSGKMKD